MAIVGYGIDLVDVERFERVWQRFGDRLLRRLFSEDEREWCIARRFPAQHLAVRFGAKEAFIKAIGSRKGLRWSDVEVFRRGEGRPCLRLHREALVQARNAGVRSMRVSMTHDGTTAMAGVILEG